MSSCCSLRRRRFRLTMSVWIRPSNSERGSALSRTVLEAALERLPIEWRARVTQREVADSASTALLAAIETEKADLIAVGFRGTSGLVEEFVLGSVSRAVAYSASVPALVVKSRPKSEEPAKQSRGSVSQRIHVLLTYDQRDYAERAAELLKRFTWPPETRGTVMTVVQRMFLAGLPDWIKVERDADVAAMAAAWETEHQQQVQAARVELESFRATLPPCFASEESRRCRGPARPKRFSPRYATRPSILPCWAAEEAVRLCGCCSEAPRSRCCAKRRARC